jgi:hypothetical protein
MQWPAAGRGGLIVVPAKELEMDAVNMRSPSSGFPVNMDRQGNLLAWASVGPMALHILPVDALLWGPLRALCGTSPIHAQRKGSWHCAGVPISACTCRLCWDHYLQSLASASADTHPPEACHA